MSTFALPSPYPKPNLPPLLSPHSPPLPSVTLACVNNATKGECNIMKLMKFMKNMKNKNSILEIRNYTKRNSDKF